MFEIQTNIPSREVELPAELTPVHERRQWLQNAFQKKDGVSVKKEKCIQSPAPRQGLVQDRVQWLKQEGEKYSKTVLPDNVHHRNLQRDPRKRWSEGEILHIHRSQQKALEFAKDYSGKAEARNDVDENMEFRNAVPVIMHDRHSFPLSNDHGTSLRQHELQIRDEPQNFLFPVVNSQGGEYEMTVDRFREQAVEEGLFSPSGPTTAERIVHPVSVESMSTPQAQTQPRPQKHPTESGSSNESRPRELMQLADSPYVRQYDRSCILSPASANSLPDYAQLNAGAMAKGNVEGIVSDDGGIGRHRRRHRKKWRKHKTTNNESVDNDEEPLGTEYVSFQTPMGKEGPNVLLKKDQLEAEMVGTQCLEHCIIL